MRIEIGRPLLVGNAAKAIGCVVRKVGGCHRVRSTGALKTRNLGPLIQSIVGHGHPFWEHLVATDLVGLNGVAPGAWHSFGSRLSLSLSGS